MLAYPFDYKQPSTVPYLKPTGSLYLHCDPTASHYLGIVVKNRGIEIKNMETLSKGDLIKADLISRLNYTNGKYTIGQIVGLDNFQEFFNTDDIFFLETLKVRADSADRMIEQSESLGRDTSDPNVMRDLGQEINALGEPIHRSESIMTAVFVSLKLIACYGIATGIWGLVFKKGFLWFGLYGAIGGILISSLFIAPVIANQRTRERVRDMVAGVGTLLVPLAIIIGVVGLVAWVISLIFF